jgi:hypothetical protein
MGTVPPEPEMEVVIPEQAKPAEGQETTIPKTADELTAEGKELVINKAVSKERQAELWARSNKNVAAYVALLRLEPEILF